MWCAENKVVQSAARETRERREGQRMDETKEEKKDAPVLLCVCVAQKTHKRKCVWVLVGLCVGCW